ncbi:MAG: hypothetical protein LQ340_004378, partial [Diploschistes diacapsis]
MAEEESIVPIIDDLPIPAFRPSKRRRVFRKRETLASPPRNDSFDHESVRSPLAVAAIEAPAKRELVVADIIRQRKAFQRRKGGGIEFSANRKSAVETTREDNDDFPEVPDTSEAPESGLKTVTSRFAAQTGQVKEELDKH